MAMYPNPPIQSQSITVWRWFSGQGDPILATSRLTVALSFVVIASAGILGFTALRDLFISINLFHPWLGYLFPILFDAAEITFAISILNAQLQGEEDRFAWAMVVVFTLFGIGANVAHALFAQLTGHITSEQAILAVIFTSLFPLSIALVTHNLKTSIKRQLKRNGMMMTLAQLEQGIQEGQLRLQQMTLLNTAIEAEQAKLESQKAALTEDIATLKKERRETKRGTFTPKSAEPKPETEQKAYVYLAEQVKQGKRNREITGAELGRVIGTSESFGRRLKKKLLDQVRRDLGIPEPTS